MHNVLKRKKMYLFRRISSYFDFFPYKSYVLEHSESIDMHIRKKNKNKKKCRCPQKKPSGGGGGYVRNYLVFFYTFPY